ncbi:glycosyltransferase [uncultured Pseudodesulfovibrio sp.]|uniref:glycosyltransferase n=1 Tax=uncultured Pseudodesulfovibrio sp. TaxID=2035858 RepID=UPI0029C72DDD|nr:glycosyltransferase [uncultured Pseudodesulfovibrio sp.]
MRILSIMYIYPPLLYPASIRNLRITHGLAAQGAQIDVVMVDPDTYEPPGAMMLDEAATSLIPDSVKVHQIRSCELSLPLRLIKSSGLLRSMFYPVVMPVKKEWTYSAWKQLDWVKKGDYDLIMSFSQPHSNHLLGMRLAEKLSLPWVAFFSDPWTRNPYDQLEGKLLSYIEGLERKVFENADSLLFTSMETVDHVMDGYGEQIRKKAAVLPHCFVPDWYQKVDGARAADNGRIKMVHTGHFYRNRSPMPLFEVLKELEETASISKTLEVVCIGQMPSECQEWISQNGLDHLITVEEPVPYLDSLKRISGADWLFFVDAPSDKPSVFLPSKLVDYLGSGKPILGVTPKQGASARVLRETGNIACDLNDRESLKEVVLGIARSDLDIRQYDNEQYSVYTISKGLMESLEDIVSG